MSSLSPSSLLAAKRRRTQGKRTLIVWIWLLGLCLAALIATYMLFVEPPPPRKIVIASGGQNGAYFRFAQKYAEDLKKEGLSVEVRRDGGVGGESATAGRQKLGSCGRHRSERRGRARGIAAV